jgi:hypothetical protein
MARSLSMFDPYKKNNCSYNLFGRSINKSYSRCWDCDCCECCDKNSGSNSTSNPTSNKIIITNVTYELDSLTTIKLTLSGSGFNQATKVIINGQIITVFSIVSDNTIIIGAFEVPENTNILTISVSSPTKTSNNFSYTLGNIPVITSISPSSGAMGPLINITIYGYNFMTLKSIKCSTFNLQIIGYPISVISDEIISFILPPIDPVQSVEIYVSTLFGNSNSVFYTGINQPVI